MESANSNDAKGPLKRRVSRNLLRLANSLTLLRLVSTPALVILLVRTEQASVYNWYALGLIAFLQTTDVLDGYFARQAKGSVPIHTVGEILDPIADKLYFNSSVIALTWIGRIPMWLGAMIVARDALILAGWLATYVGTGVRLLPNKLGKAADSAQAILLIAVLLRPPEVVLMVLFWTTAALTLASGVLYARGALSARHEAQL